jgi:Cys-rich four helix bundle protein (predicted Tat secretion target)
MNRREMFAAGLGLGVVVLARDALADVPKDKRGALLDALHTCIAKGELCQAHCQTQLGTGDKDFAHCMATVTDMLAVCNATASLVARQSARAKDQVTACAAVCKDCSAACAEHKAHFAHGMHVECKACMDSCDACVAACQSFLAG